MVLAPTSYNPKPFARKRQSNRRPLAVPGRLTWKDQRGTTRIAKVMTRDVSDDGVFVEWLEPSAIPLYRLVHFQIAPEARRVAHLPGPLRSGKVLTAVFRIGQRRKTTGTPEGYALRLLIAPEQKGTRSVDFDENDNLDGLVSATA